jgi:hypothetical protein
VVAPLFHVTKRQASNLSQLKRAAAKREAYHNRHEAGLKCLLPLRQGRAGEIKKAFQAEP